MKRATWATRSPVSRLIVTRLAAGLGTLVAVSVAVFAATQALPGNAAVAALGYLATPERRAAFEEKFHLNESLPSQYWHWISGLFRGDLGISYVGMNEGVWSLTSGALINTAVLAFTALVIAAIIGIGLGMLAGVRRAKVEDHLMSGIALVLAGMPEFVIAVLLVSLLATGAMSVLPAVSYLSPGGYGWDEPIIMILPTLTLVLVCVPYLFRMTRSSIIETLQSEFVEMAILKGLKRGRILRAHVLRNSLASIVQVVGILALYLVGAVVVVEYVFNYPGIGTLLIDAIGNRDIPVIQFLVLVVAAFYILVNIGSDVVAVLVSPRRRAPR